MILPPGTLLQMMYLRERIARWTPGRFQEVGTGSGYLSAVLLEAGWSGTGFEIDPQSAARAAGANAGAVRTGRYHVVNGDWLEPGTAEGDADLIASCMVLEHLDDAAEALYLERCRERLAPAGRGLLLVPGSPEDWGIEDDIAGHLRRYTRDRLASLLGAHGWRVDHVAGLTFPLSNLLLPLSNHLVRRAESRKLALATDERTRASGRREVPGKTVFPGIAALLLNDVMLYPLHVAQKLCRDARRALVLYAEFSRP